MTATPISAQDIARFLQDNPDFFMSHAGLFADLKVPHPHQARAISLGERQILTLRARTRELEWQLSGLVQNATGNERISKLLIDWCSRLLSEDDAYRLPHAIVHGLSHLFELPDIALRLWRVPHGAVPDEFTLDVDPEIRRDSENLTKPYCGPAQGKAAAQWLSTPPESLALLALKPEDADRPMGLLVLGSPDAQRFTTDMGTDFLQTIATLAGASLSRLSPPDQPQSA